MVGVTAKLAFNDSQACQIQKRNKNGKYYFLINRLIALNKSSCSVCTATHEYTHLLYQIAPLELGMLPKELIYLALSDPWEFFEMCRVS